MKKKPHYTLSKLIVVFIAIYSNFISPVYGQAPVANFTASLLSGCSPLLVNFQDLSSGNPTSWAWDFGNGNSSTLQNPSAAYFTPGQYTVKLTVTNASGTNALTRTQYITVYEGPTISFTANNTVGCFPLHVQFTDQSTPGSGNTNVGWQWDFGNGQTSTLQNPSVIYTSAGAFSVTLKVSNDKGCSKVLSIPNYITVTPGVHTSFTNSQAVVCRPPANITFTNTSTGPGVLSYFWDFGDGNSSVLQNPAHIYNTSGSFIVTLVTTSSGGCTDTLRSSVPVVIGGITTSFTGPASICAKAVASFNNTSSPAPGSSNWNFGDGAVSALINPTHVYTAPGTYTISLHNNYANCTDSVSQTIVVNTLPVADFSSPDTIKCEPPLTVNFQDLSSGAVSWQWNFGDGATSTLQNPVHTYNSYGNDTVRLIVTNATGCSDTIVKNNFIKIRKAIISIPSLPARGCIPFTISPVPVINSLDAVTSYLWDFGDGSPTSNLAVPTHTYIAQGTYDVTLIITTSTGCTDTLKINQAVRVGSIPIPDFSASPIPQCALQAVQFTDLSVPADQWLWNFGDGATSTVQNPTHAYGTPGSYNITLTATNNGCPATITKSNYISILPPVARFSFAANCSNRIQFTFTDQSIGPVSWDWDFGDGSPHSFLQNPVHNFPGLGIYSVILTVTNGSCSNSIMQSVHVINENPDFSAGQTVACKAADISITATNITPSNITNYNWNLGIGAPFNTTSNPIHNNFTISGSYSITLITTDINGCKDTVTKPNYIRINGPVANFTATNTSGCAGFTTTFNDLSTTDGINNIVSWQWSFGDGTVQTLSGPPFQHTYGTPGTYSVKLKITDAFGCSDSLLKSNLIVATTPHALFTSPDTLTCPGATVHFQNTSSSVLPVNSTWDFGDASTINTVGTPPVTHSYLATGSYNVKLTIVDQVGCPDSLIKNLYIRVDKPVASFTVSDSVTSCIPLQAQFTNTSQYFTSLLWDFGPGSSTITNPVHYYSSPGSYTVMLIATSPGGCQDTAFKNITVYDTAGSRIDYLPLNGCKPLSINFNAFTPGPVTYLWDFGDGFSQTTTTPNINHVYSSFGDFVPKVILRDPTGCLIPVTGIDTIHIVGATAKFGFDKNLLCDNGPVNFTDSSIFNDPITSYNWTFGDGGTSIQQNPVHQYTASGNYSVTMSIQTQNGCTDTISIINAVKVVQSPSIAITGDTAVCINLPLLHSGTFLVADTSLVIWSWNFPNGNSSALQNPPAQTYTTAGNFIVFVIATNSSGCKDTALQNIVVYPLPTVNMPGTITLQNGFPITIPATYSANTINWVWSPAQGLSCTNCPQPIASPKFNTDYTVTFSDQHGCVNSGLLHVVVICKNANLFMPNTFSPNGDGSNDVFYPRGKGLDRVKSLRIFDRWGEVVFEKNNFPINDPLYGWDGTYKGKNPQAGVYIYQVEVFCDNGDIIKLDGNIALIL